MLEDETRGPMPGDLADNDGQAAAPINVDERMDREVSWTGVLEIFLLFWRRGIMQSIN